MKKMTRVFLMISVASFAVSLTGPGSDILYGGLKPIGAVAFIAFFISNLLQKEFAAHDQEESTKVQPASKVHAIRTKTSSGHIPQHA